MARLNKCSFCKHEYSGSICTCIIRFGQSVEQQIVDWNSKNIAKKLHLPPYITKKSKDPRWDLYTEYKEVEKIKAREYDKAQIYALHTLCNKLQKIADRKMKRQHSDFEVFVSVECNKIPR